MAGRSSILVLHNTFLKHLYGHIQRLEWELVHIKYLNSQSPDDSLLAKKQDALSTHIDMLRELVNRNGGQLSQNPLLDDDNVNSTFDHLSDSFNSFLERSSLNEKKSGKIVQPQDWERYLIISVGLAIGCLDLKQCGDHLYGLPSLHEISTLKIIEEGFPICMGLFKLGPHAYMIGGQELRGMKTNPVSRWDLEPIKNIFSRYGAKASSRDTYYLSLANDDSLSLSRCDFIPPMNKPKLWPIVEKIGNQLHVIESFPELLSSHVPNDMIPSHEVLNLDNIRLGWREISPVCANEVEEQPGRYIARHIVVGDYIYAVVYNSQGTFMVFNTETNKWGELYGDYQSSGLFSIQHVAQTLGIGCGNCAVLGANFPEELKGMHVAIVLGEDDNFQMFMVAYLVKQETGQVVCFQRVRNFLDRCDQGIFKPHGRVFKVDEGGKTLCAIFEGEFEGEVGGSWESMIFIATFTIDVEVQDLLGFLTQCRSDEDDDNGDLPLAFEWDFVKVVIKDVCVYKKAEEEDPEAQSDHNWNNPGFGACFL